MAEFVEHFFTQKYISDTDTKQKFYYFFNFEAIKKCHHGRVRGAKDGGDDEWGGADGKSQLAPGKMLLIKLIQRSWPINWQIFGSILLDQAELDIIS